jgi:hypothetical protein
MSIFLSPSKIGVLPLFGYLRLEVAEEVITFSLATGAGLGERFGNFLDADCIGECRRLCLLFRSSQKQSIFFQASVLGSQTVLAVVFPSTWLLSTTLLRMPRFQETSTPNSPL